MKLIYRPRGAETAFALLLAFASHEALAGCGDRPGTPNNLKAITKSPTAVEISWENRASERPIFWDVEVLNGNLQPVGGKPAGSNYGGAGRGSRVAVTYDVPRHTTQCFRIKARTESGTQGCVSANWSAPICANTKVYGAIGDKWSLAGGEKSPVGPPVGEEIPGARGGRIQSFKNGFMAWTPQTGAHMVYGSIAAKWDQLGREHGKCGYPLTDEVDASGGNRRSNFEIGDLLWTRATNQVTDNCGRNANPRDVVKQAAEALIDNNRDTLNKLLAQQLGQGDLIGRGFTLYDINFRLGEVHVDVPTNTSFRISVTKSYLYAKSTQPTAAGSYADPAFELDFDLVLEGNLMVSPGAKPKVQSLVVTVPRLTVKPRNVVGGAMTTIIALFQATKPGRIAIQNASDKYLTRDLTAQINKRLGA
jgi:LGFP repeat